MQWTLTNEYYADSDTGYRITIAKRAGPDSDQTCYFALAPGRRSNAELVLNRDSVSGHTFISKHTGPDAKKLAIDACAHHTKKHHKK